MCPRHVCCQFFTRQDARFNEGLNSLRRQINHPATHRHHVTAPCGACERRLGGDGLHRLPPPRPGNGAVTPSARECVTGPSAEDACRETARQGQPLGDLFSSAVSTSYFLPFPVFSSKTRITRSLGPNAVSVAFSQHHPVSRDTVTQSGKEGGRCQAGSASL